MTQKEEMNDFQVGGHTGKFQLIVKDKIIYKPDRDQEADFYETASKGKLKEFLPEYYGRETVDLGQGEIQYFKMQNTISHLKHPSIIDLKMGTRTWSEDCSAKKLEHKKEVDETTTSLEFGLRFCGMKVYDEKINSFVQYEKSIYREMKSYESLKKMMKVFIMSHGNISDKEKIKLSQHLMTIEELERAIKDLKDNEVRNTKQFIATIDNLIPKLERFKKIYEEEGYQIISSSIFMFYDRDDPENTIDFKMIDFAHWKDKDHQYHISDGYLVGVETILRILKELKSENEITE